MLRLHHSICMTDPNYTHCAGAQHTNHYYFPFPSVMCFVSGNIMEGICIVLLREMCSVNVLCVWYHIVKSSISLPPSSSFFYRETGPRCPVDNTRVSNHQLFKDNFAKREVLSLNVRCSADDAGCKWQGELRDLEVQLHTCNTFLYMYIVFACCNYVGVHVHTREPLSIEDPLNI